MIEFPIGQHIIGPGQSPFVVAELSANHNKSLARALSTIEAAAEAGADAIKIQTYRPDWITFNGKDERFRIRDQGAWNGRTLYDLYSEGMTPWEWHEDLFTRAHECGLEAFSSPFDIEAVNFLESLEVPAYKIASFEITDISLIQRVAQTGKPIIISTGVADLADIQLAIDTCRDEGNDRIVILKCTSAYPAPLVDLDLLAIQDLRDQFSTLVGFSDHTQSDIASVVAVALGAVVIERHLTKDPAGGGLDAHFSAGPDEFARMVKYLNEAFLSRGSSYYRVTERAKEARKFSRSLFVITDATRGDLVSHENVRSIRPSDGLHPVRLTEIIGRRFKRDVKAGTPLDEGQLE